MIAVVVVIDGFGVGAMADVGSVRPSDLGANTALQVFSDNPKLMLPNLAALGLINAVQESYSISSGDGSGDGSGGISRMHLPADATNGMALSENATYGVANLAHDGADTYWGHQEIMGSVIKAPQQQYFHEIILLIEEALRIEGHATTRFYGNAGNTSDTPVLVVDDSIVIGDNMETDEGLNHNITASLDAVDFADVAKVARVVRGISGATRVIAFGGLGVSIDNILGAYTHAENTAGINAPLSGVYEKGYQVLHLGYAVDTAKQVPALVRSKGVATHLIGKVADIVVNCGEGNTSISTVDTAECMAQTLATITDCRNRNRGKNAFICTNIQETDLAGHSQNSADYAAKLGIIDRHLPHVLDALSCGDLLIITADHGNDPSKGSKHTRERTPVMVCVKGSTPDGSKGLTRLGERRTLSDIGATVAHFFDAPLPDAGESFLDQINT